MRMGYWKSGKVGIYFTTQELNRIGGVGARVHLGIDNPEIKKAAKGKKKSSKTTSTEPEPTRFTLVQDMTAKAGSRVKTMLRPQAKYPDLVASIAIDAPQAFKDKAIPDFALMDVDAVWNGVSYLITPEWSRREPAHVGRKGAHNGGSKTKGVTAFAMGNAIGNKPATAGNLLTPRVAALLERLNHLIERNPGRIIFWVENNGKVRAQVAVLETV